MICYFCDEHGSTAFVFGSVRSRIWKYLNNTSHLPFYICKPNKQTTKKLDTQFDKNHQKKYIEEDDYNEDKDVPLHQVLFTLGTEA